MNFLTFLEKYLIEEFDFKLDELNREKIKEAVNKFRNFFEMEEDPVPVFIAEATMPLKKESRKGIVTLLKNPYSDKKVFDEETGEVIKGSKLTSDPAYAILNLIGLWIDKTNPHFTEMTILPPEILNELIHSSKSEKLN